jgi:DNA-directed RNA polymerase subunit RPC12/RpoP
MSDAQLLHCPTCGSSLTIDSNQKEIKCAYCGNMVIVPAELRDPTADAIQSAMQSSLEMSKEMATAYQPLIQSSLAMSTRWSSRIWLFSLLIFGAVFVCILLAVFAPMLAFPFLLR